MATYINKDATSDLDPITKAQTALYADTDMSVGTGSDSSRGASIPSLASRSTAQITLAGVPNNDAFEDGGTQTVEIEVDSGSMNITGRCRVGRVNSTGTVLQTGTFTGTQTMQAGTKTFSPVAPTWSGTELCGDRFFVEFEFVNTDTMMAQTLTVGLGTVNDEVITDISENSGSCAGALVAKFINQDGTE